MRTITALFDSRREADRALARLAAGGVGLTRVSVHDRSILTANDAGPTPVPAPGQHLERSGTDRPDAVQGQPSTMPESDRRGSMADAETRRNGWGDFLDRSDGQRTGSQFASRRNGLGDFLNAGGERHGARRPQRNAWGDILDQAGSRRGAGHGRRTALGDFLDAGGQRRGAGAARRNALGDLLDDGSQQRGEDRTRRNLWGDFLDQQGHRRGDLGGDARRDSKAVVRIATDGPWRNIRSGLGTDAHIYEEGLRRGGYLLVAGIDDRLAASVVDLLTDGGVVDLQERQRRWRSDGWHDEGNANAEAFRRDRVRSYQAADTPG